jgi:hypothetical protein
MNDTARHKQLPSILDPKFRYVRSTDTDIRKTFARVRKELKLAEAKPPNVVVFNLERKS